jgi:hypothetical protein
MPRVILGGLLGGLAMWFIGFIFWGTPLSMLALSTVGPEQAAAVQAALAQNLGTTGAYPVPWPGTAAGAVIAWALPRPAPVVSEAPLQQPD